MTSRQEIIGNVTQLVGVIAILAAAFLLYDIDQRLKRAESLLSGIEPLKARVEQVAEQAKGAEAQARGADYSTMQFFGRMREVESKVDSLEKWQAFQWRPRN